MDDKKNQKRKRPLSCTPLLKFKRDENFIFDEKFMNDKLWLQKYNLKNLRKKWTQKVQTNFLIVDKKFESSSSNQDKNKIIYKDKIDEKDVINLYFKNIVNIDKENNFKRKYPEIIISKIDLFLKRFNELKSLINKKIKNNYNI